MKNLLDHQNFRACLINAASIVDMTLDVNINLKMMASSSTTLIYQ